MNSFSEGWTLIYLGMGTVFVTLSLLALLMVGLRAFAKREQTVQDQPSPPVHTTDEDEQEGGTVSINGKTVAAIIGALEMQRGGQPFRIKRIARSQSPWAQAGLRSLLHNDPHRRE